MPKQNLPNNHLPVNRFHYPPFIAISDSKQTDFVFLHEVLYLRGNGKTTTFFVMDPLNPNAVSLIVTGNHLGFYEPLLGTGFLRVNQSVIINYLYLKQIKKDNTVKLRCAHEPILLSANYTCAVKEQLAFLSHKAIQC